jgi:hypothetical protein
VSAIVSVKIASYLISMILVRYMRPDPSDEVRSMRLVSVERYQLHLFLLLLFTALVLIFMIPARVLNPSLHTLLLSDEEPKSVVQRYIFNSLLLRK